MRSIWKGAVSFGLVSIGYMWGRMCEAATGKLAAAPGQPDTHLEGKLAVGRFYFERMLPQTATHLARIQAGAASTMELPAEAF